MTSAVRIALQLFLLPFPKTLTPGTDGSDRHNLYRCRSLFVRSHQLRKNLRSTVRPTRVQACTDGILSAGAWKPTPSRPCSPRRRNKRQGIGLLVSCRSTSSFRPICRAIHFASLGPFRGKVCHGWPAMFAIRACRTGRSAQESGRGDHSNIPRLSHFLRNDHGSGLAVVR